MFGLTQTVMQQFLKFGKRVLLSVLQGHPDAKIQKPTAAEALAYSNVVTAQYDYVPDIWAACDGLKLTMQASLDDITLHKTCFAT